ncbi:MAG: fatty acid desaturase [Caldilineaceae bacterium]|nr:fatty acid desaturase [Caldilineaceae bacterium]
MNVNLHAPSANYAGWQALVAKYQQPDLRLSLWQVANSFGGFFLCWGVMALLVTVGEWWTILLTLLLAVPAAGFLVRMFIIQHDCGHGSFFKKRKVNDWVGMACSIFTLVPYVYWRKSHATHHAHHAELEERGIGDIWTLTVDEYWEAGLGKRFLYRAFRNPFFLFGIAPTINFLLLGRTAIGMPEHWRHGEKASVMWTNVALAVLWLAQIALIGWQAMLLINLPIIVIASSAGTWLFYVQHQFERTYWEHTPQWDFTLAAMHGSSYYKLPRVLQWFTGNIGFHHIHHLSPRIPNYRLEQCHAENELFQRVVQLTLRSSFSTINLTLWDEERRRLVTFREALQAKQLATSIA